MSEIFIRRYYQEENIMYYIHFIGEEAVRQLEIHTGKRLRYTTEHPYDDDGGLYDQRLLRHRMAGRLIHNPRGIRNRVE
ncbi:hypothetical protein [Duncaniella dubosii]|uniref:hypothetical protein n=1 Tax=Duncaniella dubosii TaxID=2518971 RepID=UPI003F660D59